MAKKSRSHKLQVLVNGKKTGDLIRHSNGSLSFVYSREWIREFPNFPISRKMAVREQTYTGLEVANYFDNLLPDNDQIRERVAQKTHANSQEAFDLLAQIGRDCVGALQFLSTDAPIEPVVNAKGKKVSAQKIAQILENLTYSPLGMQEDENFRISIAGAQQKTAFLQLKKSWNIPIGSTATTHIFKPSMGMGKGRDLRLSVENEWLCLKICEKYGLKVAQAKIGSFAKNKTLIVERYDREWSGQKIYRVPQEDLCQALGYPSHLKYENDGGPGIKAIMNLLNESDHRAQDRYNFIKAQIIFWLLAGIDGHAKNFSIKLIPGGFYLAPLYDVLSAEPLFANKSLNYFKVKMAMAVGKSRRYRLKDITFKHWEQTALAVGLTQDELNLMKKEIQDISQTLSQDLKKKLPKNFPIKEVFDPIMKGINTRSKLI